MTFWEYVPEAPERRFRAAALLAGELMRDSSFAQCAPQSVNAANAYYVDFGENSFHVETSVNTLRRPQGIILSGEGDGKRFAATNLLFPIS